MKNTALRAGHASCINFFYATKVVTNCIHCIARKADTVDHLIPRAWYPETTPPNFEKWNFPFCEPCNRQYSKLENRLLFQLGICLPPEDALAAGIAERVLRSVDSHFGRNPKDRQARAARRASAQRKIIFTDKPPTGGTPGGSILGRPSSRPLILTTSAQVSFRFCSAISSRDFAFSTGWSGRYCAILILRRPWVRRDFMDVAGSRRALAKPRRFEVEDRSIVTSPRAGRARRFSSKGRRGRGRRHVVSWNEH